MSGRFTEQKRRDRVLSVMCDAVGWIEGRKLSQKAASSLWNTIRKTHDYRRLLSGYKDYLSGYMDGRGGWPIIPRKLMVWRHVLLKAPPAGSEKLVVHLACADFDEVTRVANRELGVDPWISGLVLSGHFWAVKANVLVSPLVGSRYPNGREFLPEDFSDPHLFEINNEPEEWMVKNIETRLANPQPWRVK